MALSTLKRVEYFKRNVYYYAFGLAISGLIALLGEYIPPIKRSIRDIGEGFTLYQNNQLYTRFSGLDIDPNYFAFQVLFAISLLIVISSYKKNRLIESILIFILIFMGIHTLSKMFFNFASFSSFVYMGYILKE